MSEHGNVDTRILHTVAPENQIHLIIFIFSIAAVSATREGVLLVRHSDQSIPVSVHGLSVSRALSAFREARLGSNSSRKTLTSLPTAAVAEDITQRFLRSVPSARAERFIFLGSILRTSRREEVLVAVSFFNNKF